MSSNPAVDTNEIHNRRSKLRTDPGLLFFRNNSPPSDKEESSLREYSVSMAHSAEVRNNHEVFREAAFVSDRSARCVIIKGPVFAHLMQFLHNNFRLVSAWFTVESSSSR